MTTIANTFVEFNFPFTDTYWLMKAFLNRIEDHKQVLMKMVRTRKLDHQYRIGYFSVMLKGFVLVPNLFKYQNIERYFSCNLLFFNHISFWAFFTFRLKNLHTKTKI